MKIIAIFFLTITVAFSQNVEPTQRQFDYKDHGNTVNDGYLNGSLDYFKLHIIIREQEDIGIMDIQPGEYLHLMIYGYTRLHSCFWYLHRMWYHIYNHIYIT